MVREIVRPVLLIILLSVLTDADAADNLVKNPGFEETDGEPASPVIWGLPQAPGVQFAHDSDVSHTGNASGRIRGMDAEKQSRFVQAWRQDITVDPQKQYWLSTWVKCEEVTRARIGVLHRNADNEVLLNQGIDAFSGTFGWREFGGELKRVPGTTNLQLVIGLQKSTGTAWFDDISLTEYTGSDDEFGTWTFTHGPLPAGDEAPVQASFRLGRRGLQPGGALKLQWLNWRPAREFRFQKFRTTSSAADATFTVTVPPPKKSWPPIRQPIAVDLTLASDQPLPEGAEIVLDAALIPSRHSNVISPLRALIAPGPDQSARPLSNTLELKADGGEAADIRCVAEMRPVQGQPGRITVAVTDRFGNPATGFLGTVHLSCPQSDLPATYRFTEQDAGSHTFSATVPADRVSRVQATWNGQTTVSNPILPRRASEPGLYFGDIHSHCEVSGDGVGDPDLAYRYARCFHGLDFASLSDHSPVGPRWDRIMSVNDRHNVPGIFVTLLGYEWSDSRHGHRNIYFPVGEGPSIPRGLKNNTTEWWALLDKQTVEALTVPHHPNTQAAQILENGRPAWEPCDWSAINHAYQRVVEICQNRGSFEVPGPNKELRVVREDVGASVQAALAMGHRLGFIGSTDTHTGRPGTGPARCVVITSDLTRRGIWQALHDRSCYATSGAHIFLSFELNGKQMGSEIQLEQPDANRTCRWRAVGTGTIERVDLLRNNDVVQSWSGEHRDDLSGTFSLDTPCTETEWWYLRVLQEDTHLAWSSPIWVDAAR